MAGDDRVFITTPTHNYTLATLKSLAAAANATILVDTWDYVAKRTMAAASEPGVRVLCM